MTRRISIAPAGPSSWAIKHDDGFLGYAASRAEAAAIADGLAAWLREQGQTVERVEDEAEAEARGAASFGLARRAAAA